MVKLPVKASRAAITRENPTGIKSTIAKRGKCDHAVI